MGLRTDLICENQPPKGDFSGIEIIETEIEGIKINKTRILNSTAAKRLSKPCGSYYTIFCERFDRLYDLEPLKKVVLKVLCSLLPQNGSYLVVGLGNSDITPDRIGPATADGILATRHISGELKSSLGLENLREVAVISPGVLGKTGIEAAEAVKAAAQHIKPDYILAIDALAAASMERICSTVQICDTGISPGSGVKNSRRALNEQTLGIKTLAIGIPTVTDSEVSGMMVTPKEIDLLAEKGAGILSAAINSFLQPELDPQILSELL